MFLLLFVSWFVLVVCQQDYGKMAGLISMKLGRMV